MVSSKPAETPDEIAAGDVEQIDRSFPFPVPARPAAGGDHLAVGRHRKPEQLPFVAFVHRHAQYVKQTRLRHLPDADRLVVGRGDQTIARRVDGEAADERGVHAGFDAKDRRGGLRRRGPRVAQNGRDCDDSGTATVVSLVRSISVCLRYARARLPSQPRAAVAAAPARSSQAPILPRVLRCTTRSSRLSTATTSRAPRLGVHSLPVGPLFHSLAPRCATPRRCRHPDPLPCSVRSRQPARSECQGRTSIHPARQARRRCRRLR